MLEVVKSYHHISLASSTLQDSEGGRSANRIPQRAASFDRVESPAGSVITIRSETSYAIHVSSLLPVVPDFSEYQSRFVG